MFFFFAALIIGLVLSLFLAPKPKLENAKAAALSDFQFPRSKEGDPVPRVYGTVRIKGVNTIGLCKFRTMRIRKKVKTGMFSSKKQTIGYKYYATLDLSVALGPGIVYRRMWYGDHLVWAGCLYEGDCVTSMNINLPELLGGKDKNGGIAGDVTLYCGSFDQPTDAYLQANMTLPNPDDVFPAYPGIAHMVFEDFYWGNSPNIEPINVEVAYFNNSLGLTGSKHVMPNGLDANPVAVLYDLYVNDWGNLGVSDPIFDLASWRAAGLKLWDENNGISVEIANANTGADITKEILRQIDGMIFQNPQTGMIELLLMRRDYVIAELPVLGPDQISSIKGFTKKLWDDTFNRVRIKYRDRDNNYQDAVATADDFGNIRFQGHVRATDIAMPLCYVPELANTIAARELSNLNVPLYQCEIEMDRTYSELTPGGVFVLTWPDYSIGGIVMRIRKMGLGSRKTGKVTMTVVQDEFASDAVILAPPAPPTTDDGSYGPTDIVDPVFMELPYWLITNAALTVRAGFTTYATLAKKPGIASLDEFTLLDDSADPDVEDTELLANGPYNETATLVADLLQWDSFDTGVIPVLVVNNLSSASILFDGGTDDTVRTIGQGMLYINGELLAYETHTDNLDGTYDLENVHRALLDTAPVAAPLGTTVYFFDGQEGFWESDIGSTPFTAYALDRATTGRSTEALADKVLLTPAVRTDLPLPPDGITLEATRDTDQFAVAGTIVDITWVERNRLDPAIALELDAAIAHEVGTTYTLRVVRASDDVVLQTETPVTSPYALTIDPAITPAGVRIEVSSVVGALESFTPAMIPLTVIDADTLLIDNDIVLFDTVTVEL